MGESLLPTRAIVGSRKHVVRSWDGTVHCVTRPSTVAPRTPRIRGLSAATRLPLASVETGSLEVRFAWSIVGRGRSLPASGPRSGNARAQALGGEPVARLP